MPGYEFNRPSSTLGLGARRPLPSAVPQGGWKMSVNHPLFPAAAQAQAQMRQQAAQTFGPLRAPGQGNPMLRPPGGAFLPGEYRAQHPTGGIDSSPGHPGLFSSSARGAQAHLQETTPPLSQQSSYHQDWAHNPARMAEFKASQEPQWSPERLQAETGLAMQGKPYAPSGQGLLAGTPQIAVPQRPTLPRIAMPRPGPAVGAMPEAGLPTTPDGAASGLHDFLTGHLERIAGGSSSSPDGVGLMALAAMHKATMPEPPRAISSIADALLGRPEPGSAGDPYRNISLDANPLAAPGLDPSVTPEAIAALPMMSRFRPGVGRAGSRPGGAAGMGLAATPAGPGGAGGDPIADFVRAQEGYARTQDPAMAAAIRARTAERVIEMRREAAESSLNSERTRAEIGHFGALTDAARQNAKIDPEEAALHSSFQSGALPWGEYQSRLAILRARKQTPGGATPGGIPTASTPPSSPSGKLPAAMAMDRLRQTVPDLDSILGGSDEKPNAVEALARAIERGHAVGPGHEGEPTDNDFRAVLRARMGDDDWEREKLDPERGGIVTWGHLAPEDNWWLPRALNGYLPWDGASAERDYNKAMDAARWARGGRPAGPQLKTPIVMLPRRPIVRLDAAPQLAGR